MERKPIPAFTFEKAFSEYFALLKNRGWSYVKFNLLCTAPYMLLLIGFICAAVGVSEGMGGFEYDSDLTLCLVIAGTLLTVVLAAFLNMLVVSGNALITRSYYDGQKVSTGATFRYAFHRLGAVASVSLPIQLLFLIPYLLLFVFIPPQLYGKTLTMEVPQEFFSFFILYMVFMLVFGLLSLAVSVLLPFAVHSAAYRGKKWIGAVKYNWSLIRPNKNWLKVFGYNLLFSMIAQFVVGVVFGILYAVILVIMVFVLMTSPDNLPSGLLLFGIAGIGCVLTIIIQALMALMQPFHNGMFVLVENAVYPELNRESQTQEPDKNG